MLYTELTKEAACIAYRCHDEQLDKAGMPYIFHPIHLAEQLYLEDEVILALLHDCYEDNKEAFINEINRASNKFKHYYETVIQESLMIISRNSEKYIGNTYLEYISNIKSNRLASVVKTIDLLHNMDTGRFNCNNTLIHRYISAYNMLNCGYKYSHSAESVFKSIKTNTSIEAYPYTLKFNSFKTSAESGYTKLDTDITVKLHTDAVCSNENRNKFEKLHLDTEVSNYGIVKISNNIKGVLPGRDLVIDFIFNCGKLVHLDITEIIK